jgi:NADH-quinone oxidoreductase subunit L
MTILYLFRVFFLVFLGESKLEAKEGSKSMVLSVVSLAALSLICGILINFPLRFLIDYVTRVLGAT